MVHFTYTENPDFNVLYQGDILERTDELVEVFNTYHPHYASDEYTHFQVLTQSCDLVLRDGSKCSSRYITLAAVRSLDTVIKRILSEDLDSKKILEVGDEYWCSDNVKSRLSSFIETLFNNNDKKYFYLKEYPEHGLTQDSCAFLHLSIALKSHEHYDKCLKAKKIQLESNFQSKLGWLVGNLYSRVGTEDFVPGHFKDQSDFKAHINDVINNHVIWVESKNYSLIKSAYQENTNLSLDELIGEAASRKSLQKAQARDQFIRKISLALELDDEARQTLDNFLQSGPAKQFLAEKLL